MIFLLAATPVTLQGPMVGIIVVLLAFTLKAILKENK
jgi:hypothetical protein